MGMGGADPGGITNGLLWPYIRALSVYKCSLDDRIATSGDARFIGKPILRSISMNSFMAGTSYGVSPTYTPTMPNLRNAEIPVLLEEHEISRPSRVWVILEEDPRSINDGMFLMDMGGSRMFMDLPSRLHSNAYGINFADGHVEQISLRDPASLSWIPGTTGGNTDWLRLSSITTNPLQ
jgi:prepilin-type processing-associated H-X9-DG protein